VASAAFRAAVLPASERAICPSRMPSPNVGDTVLSHGNNLDNNNSESWFTNSATCVSKTALETNFMKPSVAVGGLLSD
jgi:hypothetical protein